METPSRSLAAIPMEIDTRNEHILFLHSANPVFRSEGYEALTRIRVRSGQGRELTATLNVVRGDRLEPNQAGLSASAWHKLGLQNGEEIRLSHVPPIESFGAVRGKIYGNRFSEPDIRAVLKDIVDGHYSNVHIASFLTACAGRNLNLKEMVLLTRGMVDIGNQLDWGPGPVFDKHCVGGLPGNRTTPLVASICAAAGLVMPKTSSRAITSPAGTADTMETMTRVDLTIEEMREVVSRTGACLSWGGSVQLSPADDILIRVERALDIDSDGQMIASILSKKKSAGSTHVVLDIPMGSTAKVRTREAARRLKANMERVGRRVDLTCRVLITDGSQPIGKGIGPVLEALDVLAVLENKSSAPRDLAEKSIALSAELIALARGMTGKRAYRLAEKILHSGAAWQKFLDICEAQGGFQRPQKSDIFRTIQAAHSGTLTSIDNRRLARVAKLAGAPADSKAGVRVHKKLGDPVRGGDPLYTIFAETPGELTYAAEYAAEQNHIFYIGE